MDDDVKPYHKQILSYVEATLPLLKRNITSIKDLNVILDLIRIAETISEETEIDVITVPLYDIKFDRFLDSGLVPSTAMAQMGTLEGGPTKYKLVQDLKEGDTIIVYSGGYASCPKVRSIVKSEKTIDISLIPGFRMYGVYNMHEFFVANFRYDQLDLEVE